MLVKTPLSQSKMTLSRSQSKQSTTMLMQTWTKKKSAMIMTDKVNKRKKSKRNQPRKKARKRLEPKNMLLMSTQKIQILEWAGIPNQSNIGLRSKSKKTRRMKS